MSFEAAKRHQRLVAMTEAHATSAEIAAALGPPDKKTTDKECPQGWTYALSKERSATVCFDESGRAARLKMSLDVSRTEY